MCLTWIKKGYNARILLVVIVCMNAPSSQPRGNAIEQISSLSFEDILFQLQYVASKKSSNECLTIVDLLREYDDILTSEMSINGITPQEVLEDKENELQPLREQLIKYHNDLQKRGLLENVPTKTAMLMQICPQPISPNIVASAAPSASTEGSKNSVGKIIKTVRSQVALFLY